MPIYQRGQVPLLVPCLKRKALTMDTADCPDEQPSDPLKKFVDESLVVDNLQHIDSVCPLYHPNTRMNDFSGKSIILCQNFVSTDDPSITQQCFYTLGKNGNGRPNQRSMCAPVQSSEIIECRCCRPLNCGQGLVNQLNFLQWTTQLGQQQDNVRIL